jgi:hypothetical protein
MTSMQHLGSLRGAGLLLIGEERHDVTYRIDVWRDRKGEKTGSGALSASPKILDAAFHAKRVALHLATGETVEVRVQHLFSGEMAGLVTIGAVPGF